MYIELVIKAAPHINPAKSEPYTKQSWNAGSSRGRAQPAAASSLLEVVLGPALEADLAEGEHDEQTQVPRHQPQPATCWCSSVSCN